MGTHTPSWISHGVACHLADVTFQLYQQHLRPSLTQSDLDITPFIMALQGSVTNWGLKQTIKNRTATQMTCGGVLTAGVKMAFQSDHDIIISSMW